MSKEEKMSVLPEKVSKAWDNRKGPIEYRKEGEIFDDMKKWNPKQHPGHAAAVLKVEEVYSGSEKLS